MNCRCLASLGAMALAVGVAAGLMSPQPIAGQAQSAQPKAAATPAKPWTGKTPEGVPDLQGYWTNNSYTPLQRDANMTKEFFTNFQSIISCHWRNSSLKIFTNKFYKKVNHKHSVQDF